ncbi:putative ankyrin repeat domain-containing protein 20A2 isoform X1 [Rhopalosiphum padi]|uniref:putative ankyrin repeat domain-containing protein 20A2 isoform X1 n=2 Tax=Rhopalosiphum padi TaxID=40932 RepID=UPI00298DE320|nr:putative ankyrin repeat domain-containing protein 20A2 isoform X1 [Rhopalosiphum padi]XP_060853116.1 putative ankyrin repeat domain-containing protein 20A2 isoform X1 [Rhopalosiphum padi]
MKKMLKLVKGGKKEDKSGSGTPSGDELEDDPESAIFCYKIDSETEEKMSRLHRASWHGSLEKVKTLLQKKPMDVNIVDSFDRTPLHLAMAKGYYNIAWVLLNHNASLDYVDCDGYTPFLKAVECGQKECVHLMLERGADVTCTDKNKNTALHLAAKQGSFTIISMLLKKGININAQNAAGESVLHVACAAENRDLIEFILDNGSLINIADNQGRTPLMVVAKLGNMSIVDLLLDRGSQLDACDINGLSVKDYAIKEGHSKVVNQLSMQKMSIMARTRSKENVLDDLDQNDGAQLQENNDNSNNQKIVDAQIIVLKNDKISKSNVEDNQNEKELIAFSSTAENDDLKVNKIDVEEVDNKKENLTLNCEVNHPDELKTNKLNNENNQKEKENVTLNSTLKNENEINNSSIETDKEVIEKNKLTVEMKNTSTVNVLPIKDEESVSQCTMPPPLDPPRSWDFIQTSIIHTTDINEKVEKETQESIEQIPDPIVCAVNTDDSELEWGSDESLPTDPNQLCPTVDDKKEENKKMNTFYNFITTKLMNKTKNRVSASAENIIDDTTTKKHVRNKSFTSLRTFKLTVPSDVNKALYQLSPEMNFAHSSFNKSKSFNEHIPTENVDKNSLEFERSKSLCLELKHNYDITENQQRDSDSQSDDSLRSKRSLLLSMRMPKVHDEHHDDYHLEVKDSETSEDEGPHYWYSPNKKNDKIVQQDTVIKNYSESDSESEEIGLPKSKSTLEGISKEHNTSDNSDTENTISFSTSHEDIYGTHKRTRYALKRTESLKAYLKRVTIDKDRLQQESSGYREITELLKYKLGNLKQDISSKNETTKRLKEQLDQLDAKYTEALNRIQTLELSSTNLDKENQFLKKINKELTDKFNNDCNNSAHKSVEIITQLESGNFVDQTEDDMCTMDSKTIIKQLQEQLKLEQDRRIELDERVKLLSVKVNEHQSCSSTVELLKELQCKITKDYIPKKEVLKLKTEQERKISKVKMEAEKKLADKFCDLDKLLSQQMDQQGKLEMQREKIESQLKQEFENTRQRFQLEIAKLQTTLKTKEMEEQILRERCEILSQEIEKTQDNKWKTLVDKTYGINDMQKSSPIMLSMHCKTPEPSPTFERQELRDISRYQYNVQTLRNELDKVITQNINAALEDDTLVDE